MGYKPPHLEDSDEDILSEDIPHMKNGKIGPQGPSKYGKGGSRVHKALGRKLKKK